MRWYTRLTCIERDAIHASRSWRITKPLRALTASCARSVEQTRVLRMATFPEQSQRFRVTRPQMERGG